MSGLRRKCHFQNFEGVEIQLKAKSLYKMAANSNYLNVIRHEPLT